MDGAGNAAGCRPNQTAPRRAENGTWTGVTYYVTLARSSLRS